MTEQEYPSTPGWLELYDLKTHSDVEQVAPVGFYIRGTVGGATAFEPASAVLGEFLYKPPENVVPGWVELAMLETHRDMESVYPKGPFIHGTFDDKGHFYPDEPPSIVGGPVEQGI